MAVGQHLLDPVEIDADGDVHLVWCDGLSGFPEAIEATWPQATVQTCVVHLIRASMRVVSYKDEPVKWSV